MKLGRIVFSKSFCLKLLSEYVSITLGVTKMVDGWPLRRDCVLHFVSVGAKPASTGRSAPLRLHRNPQGNPVKRRATLMLTIEGLLAVLSFGLACFSVGYAIGRNDNRKTQK